MARIDGRLDNAPVVYVLCQIRFSPVEKMADYIPAVQEALRAEYPIFEREQIGGVSLGPNGQPTFVQNESRWRFETRDQQTGYMLSTNQLITHTTAYIDSEDFRSRIVSGFRTVHELAKLSFIQRLGLRYIDLIIPKQNDRLEDYVNSALIGFRPQVPGLSTDVSQQFFRTHSQMGGTLLMRASRALHASALPADLLPTSLKLSREPNPEQESMLLDWDHYIESLNLDPDPDALAEKLRSLKAPIAKIFEEAITEHAVKVWKGH
jgi:uncharacterized protein (TIGR04255 family)